MGEAIGQSLPMAIGVALSPIPIIAVVLMLTTKGARRNGPAFVLGWLAGLTVVGVIVLAIVGPAATGPGGPPPAWVSWTKLVLGTLLLVVAARQFAGRPAPGAEPQLPKWMGSIDGYGPLKSLGTGAALAGANPKNLLLAVAAGTSIAQTGISGAQQAVAYGVFALVGTLGIAAPVVLYVTMQARSAELLARVKDWLGRNNAVIMSVLCLVIGVKLIGDAIGGLVG